MILIDGKVIEGEDLLQVVLESEDMKSASNAFLSDPIQSIPRHEHSLCIFQGEQALVRLHQDPRWNQADPSHSSSATASNAVGATRLFIGSEDATTCMIVVVHDPEAGVAWAAHYDEPLAEHDHTSFLEDVDPLLSSRGASLFMIGAFEEPSGVSLRICRALLLFFHMAVRKGLNLRLACIYSANTVCDPMDGGKPASCPACIHLAVDCEMGRAHPACFEDRGPGLPRRMAYGHCSCSKETGPRLLRVYDTRGSRLRLPGFDAALPEWHLQALKSMSRLDDASFLR